MQNEPEITQADRDLALGILRTLLVFGFENKDAAEKVLMSFQDGLAQQIAKARQQGREELEGVICDLLTARSIQYIDGRKAEYILLSEAAWAAAESVVNWKGGA